MTPIVCATREPVGRPFERLRGGVTLRVGLETVEEAEGILCFPGDPVDGAVIARGAALRVISTASVGYDHVDVEAAARRGIVVTHTPGVLTDATAELCFALILACARRVVEADRYARSGAWKGFGFDLLLGLELAGSTLGIVGAGRIGAAVAERALAFRMDVLYASPSGKPALEARGARHVPLDALLEQADIVSLHVPLSESTHHLIGAPELARMKPGSILVNTARGPVVDEAALAKALEAGRPGAAGLDVFEAEPTIHPALLATERALLLPHLGSATRRTRDRMADLAVRNLLAALRGERPPHAVQAG